MIRMVHGRKKKSANFVPGPTASFLTTDVNNSAFLI
jgi:hypothetical protein